MTTSEQFSQNFGGKPVPPALISLLQFQQHCDPEYYAEGFDLQYDDKSGLRYGWSDQPAFLDRLIPFAKATHGGSTYALWIHDENAAPAELPVVLFGDEGGEYVVAENVMGLLQLLTLDTEPMTYERVSYYRSPDDEHSLYAAAYRDWLKKQFGLDALRNADDIVEPAQAKYQGVFDEWKKGFVKAG